MNPRKLEILRRVPKSPWHSFSPSPGTYFKLSWPILYDVRLVWMLHPALGAQLSPHLPQTGPAETRPQGKKVSGYLSTDSAKHWELMNVIILCWRFMLWQWELIINSICDLYLLGPKSSICRGPVLTLQAWTEIRPKACTDCVIFWSFVISEPCCQLSVARVWFWELAGQQTATLAAIIYFPGTSSSQVWIMPHT